MGLLPIRSGDVKLDNRSIGCAAAVRARALGIGYVPQGREIFPRLTVGENLQMGLATQKRGAGVPSFIFEMFPVLKDMLDRRGGDLSGGQQQQLAIGRALALRPRLLILDEPTEGIQPSIIKDIERAIRKLTGERRDGDPAGRAVLRLREIAGRPLRRDVARRSGGERRRREYGRRQRRGRFSRSRRASHAAGARVT